MQISQRHSRDPLVLRATFGMLNIVLYFPTGSFYPKESFPQWMRLISMVDPFTYAVDEFKSLILKNTGLMPISTDMAFLAALMFLAMTVAPVSFDRAI